MDSCIDLVQFAIPAAELMQIGPPPLAVIAKERRAAAALKLKFSRFKPHEISRLTKMRNRRMLAFSLTSDGA
jgi:hypothetical protein